MTKKRIHTIYAILLSIVTVIAGICLMAACLQIYRSGDKPYSPEAVQAAFATIAVPVYLCVALIIGGFIIDGFFPFSCKKDAPPKQYEAILNQLYENADPALRNSKERRSRLLHKRISLILLAICSAVFLIYGLNGNNFALNTISQNMITACSLLLGCMAIPFGYAVFTAYYTKASIKREIETLKQAGISRGQCKKISSRNFLWVRWAILGVGVVLLVVGFAFGGTKDVLTKAVNLCTECVGLG